MSDLLYYLALFIAAIILPWVYVNVADLWHKHLYPNRGKHYGGHEPAFVGALLFYGAGILTIITWIILIVVAW